MSSTQTFCELLDDAIAQCDAPEQDAPWAGSAGASDPFDLSPNDCCAHCPSRRPVSSSGPLDAPIMFIGESPGWVEDRHGVPLIGPTGQEFNEHYLPLAGLARSQCYVTNIVKCKPPYKENAIPPERVAHCAALHLRREVLAVRPQHVVLMGATANLLRDSISVDMEHGRTVETLLFGHPCKVTTLLHPAAGLHKTERIREIREDFQRLGETLRGRGAWPVDPWFNKYWFAEPGDTPNAWTPPLDGGPVAIDTEYLGRNAFTAAPWCVTYSTADHNGYLIRAEDRDGLTRFQQLINGRPVVFHNAVVDLEICERLGLSFASCPSITDTQILAYVRGYLGHNQSLKSLGYRLLGVRMRTFDDLVQPYAAAVLLDWLEYAATLPDYPPPIGRAWSVERRILSMVKSCREKDGDAIVKYAAWDDEFKAMLEDAMNEDAPSPTINLAPFDEALVYACQDANVTRRLWKYLMKNEPAAKWKVSKGDRD